MMSRNRRNRRNDNKHDPDVNYERGGLAEYKNIPSVSPLTEYPPLYSSCCSKCCPQSTSYIVDQSSTLLGLVDMSQYYAASLDWRWRTADCVRRWCWWSGLSRQIIVSPGQVEVLQNTVKTGAVVLLPSQPEMIMMLLYSGAVPPDQTYCLTNNDSWMTRALNYLGISFIEETDIGKSVKRGGLFLIDTNNLQSVLNTVLAVEDLHRDVVLVPSSVSEVRGDQARLDIGLGLSVTEMMSRGVEEVIQHQTIISMRLTKISPASLVSFIINTGYCHHSSSLHSLTSAVTNMRQLLEARGAEMSFSGDPGDVVRVGVKMLGGHIVGDTVQLKLDTEHKSGVDQYFIVDSVVSACVMSQISVSFKFSRLGDRSGDSGCLISYDRLVERSIFLIQMLGLDRSCLLPCQDLRQVVQESVHRAEMLEALTHVSRPRSSQYGAGGNTRQRPKSAWQDDYSDNFTGGGRAGPVLDTELVVGVSEEGREWLVWSSGLVKHRLSNMSAVLRVLYEHRDEEVFTITELSEMVREGGHYTHTSLQALSELDLVTIIPKKEVMLIKVISKEMVKQFLHISHEYSCGL